MFIKNIFFIATGTLLFVGPALPDEPTANTYGQPGLIETPTAEVFDDGELRLTYATTQQTGRTTVTFQVLPGLSGSFRYAGISNYLPDGTDNFDRSFDLRYQLIEENDRFPSIAVGLRDFIGTGIYSSEYIVATKNILPNLKLTGGIGWGRMAGNNTFRNPLSAVGFSSDERIIDATGLGGQVEAGRWFQGPAALFGGIDWQATKNLSLQFEVSQDRYVLESRFDQQEISFPINAGVEYKTPLGIDVKAYVVGGEDFGVQLSYALNPKERFVPSGQEPAPTAILTRDSIPTPTTRGSPRTVEAEATLAKQLSDAGLKLESLHLDTTTATLHVRNLRWDVEAQAAGRAARAMANSLPPQYETLIVVFQERGLPLVAVTTNRSDLEKFQYDFDAAWRTRARSVISDASINGQGKSIFSYNLGPYVSTSFFDPQSPIRADFGAQIDASYQAAPGFTLDAVLRYPLAGNLGDSERESDSLIPRVRSESFIFARESELEINRLTAEYLWRPGADTFARISAGYLENQFGGVSTEVLWSPIESRFAIGAELNYARQRDFNMLFGFQDYDVVTGHASAYYDLGGGFQTQVDLGRYLAGDWGGTFTLNREFNNGVKVGGYFTLTDVPFEDFGEGSFDKGLTVEIPLSFFTGEPSRKTLRQTVQPLLRDGGARLNVNNRLYPLTRDYRGPELSDGWGRYLR